MQRPILFILAALLAAQTFAQDGPDERATVSERQWDEWKARIRGFDEIRMTEPMAMTEVPVKWTPNGIRYEQKPIPHRLLHAAKRIKDPDSFIQLLDYEPDRCLATHACLGLFHLNFFRNGERVGFMYYAHGIYWAPLTPDAQRALNRWLREQGFPIEQVLAWPRAQPRVRF